MGYTDRWLVRLSIVFFICLHISLSLDINDLLQGALLKLSIRFHTLLLRYFSSIIVNIHSLVTISRLIKAGDLLTNIMILRVISNLNLDDLTIHYIWCLLLDRGDLACAFVSDFYGHIYIDKLACVDVFSLQKSRLNSEDVEVSESLQVIAIV